MKAILFTIAAMLSVVSLNAQETFKDVSKTQTTVINGKAVLEDVVVDSVRISHDGSHLVVDMELGLSDMATRSKGAVLLTPRLTNGKDTLDLPSVGIYGRQRYYFNKRNDISVSGGSEDSYKLKDMPDLLLYHTIVKYQPWMNGSDLSIIRRDYGCCNNLLAEQARYLGAHHELVPFYPEFLFVRPEIEVVKARTLEGSAYIDFPVDQTVIYPEYRNNTVELAKILETIDLVSKDKDITITSVWLKGFASPESPYEHNKNLAIGRTNALKTHIQKLYHFEEGLISTEYEPENWEGLRKYVEESKIENRSAILEIINMEDRDPDTREWILKSKYPEQYRFLLRNCYPALRRTDYRIAYTIRSYSDIEEIRKVFKTNPQNLSLIEFHLLSQTMEPGTQEFTDIFETAVRMYQDDQIANLNAANAAMRRKDFVSAQRYLDKAGDSKEAVYARGVYAYLNHDLEKAEACFTLAAEAGIEPAKAALKAIAEEKTFYASRKLN